MTRLTTVQLIEKTVVASVTAFRGEYEALLQQVADERTRRDEVIEKMGASLRETTIIIQGDGTANNRGLRGEVRDIGTALFGNGSNPGNLGFCERVRNIEAWRASWDRVKWVVIGVLVSGGVALIADIVLHVIRANAGG